MKTNFTDSNCKIKFLLISASSAGRFFNERDKEVLKCYLIIQHSVTFLHFFFRDIYKALNQTFSSK